MKNSMTAAPVFFQILVKAHILRNASQKQGAYWISDTTTGIFIQITGIEKALQNAGIHVEAEYVTDMEKVMTYGIMSMPGLVINEQVVSAGKVLKPKEIEKLLQKAQES